MKWNKLKDFKCPKCSCYLQESITFSGYFCKGSCDFKIKEERFNEIVNNGYKPKEVEKVDNQEMLNNL